MYDVSSNAGVLPVRSTPASEGVDLTPAGAVEPRTVIWRNSLQFRVTFALVSLLAMIILSISLVLWIAGRSRMIEESERLYVQTGGKMVAELRARMTRAESVTNALADLGCTLEPDEARFKSVIPAVINGTDDGGFIAGGGIWPEPGEFTTGVERRSFFWGRNQSGTLEYFDDYNRPDGPGYQHEEWYVPARHLAPRASYWSVSYTDPYSGEPMVTCTAAMRRDGRFVGVATVDVKLNGLREFFAREAEQVHGYAFAVDRNNKLLCFPEPDLARFHGADAQGKPNQDYLDANALAAREPLFGPLARLLGRINSDRSTHADDAAALAQVSARIDADSYQIDAAQAATIAAMLAGEGREAGADGLTLGRLTLSDDPILGEPVNIHVFDVPGTYWKVIAVVPVHEAEAAASSITRRVLGFTVVLVALAWGAVFIGTRRSLILPLRRMTSELRHAAGSGPGDAAMLDDSVRSELGLLAFWFNQRTRGLAETMHALEESKANLEQRVRSRTAELELAQVRAEDAARAKTDFLANMSHEIRTPMTAILGFADLLEDNSVDAVRRVDAVATIKRHARHLLTIINDVLDISKIEAGRMTVESIEYSPAQIAEEVASLMRVSAGYKGLVLDLTYDGKIPAAMNGDPTRLRQILLNLVGNAVKFTEKGRVTISVHVCLDPQGDARLAFRVTDTGIGMTPEQMGRMFQSFSQGDGTMSRRFGGTGLGLAISKRLAALMGGEVAVESAENVGSTFTLMLPAGNLQSAIMVDPGLATLHRTSDPTLPTEGAALPLAGVRILLAEDGVDNRRLITFYLAKAGARVHAVANGKLVIETLTVDGTVDGPLLEPPPVDLLLSDMQMPELDGYAMARLLRAKGCRLPIIALTAHAMSGDEQKCISAGCDRFVPKPIDRARLIEACVAGASDGRAHATAQRHDDGARPEIPRAAA
jgi:signal transduction histidine kinase/CheY-like chemotaxis protein